jgi:hypothetical protein
LEPPSIAAFPEEVLKKCHPNSEEVLQKKCHPNSEEVPSEFREFGALSTRVQGNWVFLA